MTEWPVIAKHPSASDVRPNLVDYEATCRSFSGADARAALDGLPAGGLNIAHETSTATGQGGVGYHVHDALDDGPALGYGAEALAVTPTTAALLAAAHEVRVGQIAAELERLEREAMVTWADSFTEALHRDLIDAEDFVA